MLLRDEELKKRLDKFFETYVVIARTIKFKEVWAFMALKNAEFELAKNCKESKAACMEAIEDLIDLGDTIQIEIDEKPFDMLAGLMAFIREAFDQKFVDFLTPFIKLMEKSDFTQDIIKRITKKIESKTFGIFSDTWSSFIAAIITIVIVTKKNVKMRIPSDELQNFHGCQISFVREIRNSLTNGKYENLMTILSDVLIIDDAVDICLNIGSFLTGKGMVDSLLTVSVHQKHLEPQPSVPLFSDEFIPTHLCMLAELLSPAKTGVMHSMFYYRNKIKDCSHHHRNTNC